MKASGAFSLFFVLTAGVAVASEIAQSWGTATSMSADNGRVAGAVLHRVRA